jgi:formiminoglutamase
MINVLYHLDRRQIPAQTRGQDPNETTLREFISFEVEDYRPAEIVIVGSPQDEGVRRNGGRTGARKAPAAIRNQLYRFPVSGKIKDILMTDIGDIRPGRTLEESHDIHEQVVYQLLEDNKTVIVLGGGNDISYPDLRALSRNNKSIAAINIDSHYDVRADQPRNSGTPYRQALEEKLVRGENFYEVGQKPIVNAHQYHQYLIDNQVNIYTLETVRKRGIKVCITELIQDIEQDRLFWGFDMDAVNSAEAPGVSAPYPLGLSAEEFCQAACLAGSDPRSAILEISEVNPDYDDHNESTSRLATMLILSFLKGYHYRGDQSDTC